MDKHKRPVYLNLPKLGSKMSITAKVSILHRVSGVLMFLAIPLVLMLLHKSLTNPEFYGSCFNVMSHPIMKLVYLVLIWSLMHHMCAGMRFLFLDVHKGIERTTAQMTAKVVLIVSLLLTAVLGALILW
jgi:succinate dehydrogenase / fumarate reductase cytochrome b subunit